MSGIQVLKVDAVGRFGHHPDQSTDFCIEVEVLQSQAENIRIGYTYVNGCDWRATSENAFWSRLSRILRFVRSRPELDDIAQRAVLIAAGLESHAFGNPGFQVLNGITAGILEPHHDAR